MSADREHWNRFYDEGKRLMEWPSESVVRFVRRFKVRAGTGARALDLGCGNGRHLILFHREGFEGHGCDISKKAVELANAWLKDEGLPERARIMEEDALPFEDGRFDIICSHGVLDSMLPDVADALVRESWRCLKPGGEVFASVRASADLDYMHIGRQVAPNTVEVETEFERGTYQHFFDLAEVMDLFARFEVTSLEREDRTDWLRTGRALCRWNLTARKPS